MSYFEDLLPCSYFGEAAGQFLRSVGWLQRGKPFVTGIADEKMLSKLRELLKDPWQPFVTLGLHDCELCHYYPEARGTKNLFVPGERILFVSPELILHYMNAHGYCPPSEFCEAVLRCPDTRTSEYRRAILQCGGHVLIESKAQLNL